ncbi:CubicO group peptidase (beta-lactamase class C family) [Anaerobacterium chartisolvens]|uniref:CubicO group peptidase (Beta-lactamase class C family) n=1 Tax=Anaerobacterium chartisolvens TaxID=1297424 RepID=A0A369BHD8_9FIRM|nr:serine hydrolase [Anaerobacterium chartisolvens]RCX20821.1 CubicO group peptidase (beta-lactamase class C family) [Anaerobacterium chartisolvens]
MRGKAKEIIAISIILIIAVSLSMPSYLKERKTYKAAVKKESKAEVGAKLQQAEEWMVSSPAEQGMDKDILDKAGEMVGKTAAYSLIVIRHGNIVMERYYNGAGMDDANNVFSVTKSFMSALVGIAADKGFIKNIDQRISEYIPEYYQNQRYSDKKQITIRHLLTMTPGFCEDLGKWIASDDWVRHTLELSLKYEPGERFQYANSASHLLSVILTKATKTSTLDFAEKHLFNPLNIEGIRWASDPQGYYTGYANMHIRPRDMAKFGLMYLNGGMFNGRQVVPRKWVEESTRKQVETDPKRTANTTAGYGFKWWTGEENGYYVYVASGYGGQNICVIPELDIVAVTTSMPYGERAFSDEDRARLIREFIIPSVLKK